jgi:XTP/dITP diphosphohydrolase
METLLVATQNRHKLAEFAELLADLNVQVVTLADVAPHLDIAESGETFLENARHKAVTAARATGLLTLADDSGLAVDALGGAPGVHSKRYAPTDAERIRKLLAALHDIPRERWSACFHCAMATPVNEVTHARRPRSGPTCPPRPRMAWQCTHPRSRKIRAPVAGSPGSSSSASEVGDIERM